MKMKVKDLRGLSMPDLQKKLKDSRQELFNLRFQMATGQLQNHRQIRHVRRNLAQILTEIHMKELDGEPVEVGAARTAAAATDATEGKRKLKRKSESVASPEEKA